MELEAPVVVVSVPASNTVDLNKVVACASNLKVNEEGCREKLPKKERKKNPFTFDLRKSLVKSTVIVNSEEKTREQNRNEVKKKSHSRSSKREVAQQQLVPSSPENSVSSTIAGEEKKDFSKPDVPKEKSSSKVTKVVDNKDSVQNNNGIVSAQGREKQQLTKEVKSLKYRALSLDSEMQANESVSKPPTERRRSKIFETAEKFNQLVSPVEFERPKKIFIPGVNVGGAKLAFERKANLSTATVPQAIKGPMSKIIIEVPLVDENMGTDKNAQMDMKEKERRREEEKKRAVDIITGALGKPPMQRKPSGSPTVSPRSIDPKRLGLKIPVSPNDLRTAKVTVSTPTESGFHFESKTELQTSAVSNATHLRAQPNAISSSGSYFVRRREVVH